MEHPVFSISTKPDRNVRRYENGKNFVEITPSVKGLATVHDRDVLIFCISQVMAAINEGRENEVSPKLRFKAYDLLSATNRGTDGRGYEQLRAALERLSGTRIITNVTTGNVEVLDGFGLIDRFRIVRETRDGRMQDIEVTLSEWVFNAISAREVLTLHRNYSGFGSPSSAACTKLDANTAARLPSGRSAWKSSSANAARTRLTRSFGGWSPTSSKKTRRTITCPTTGSHWRAILSSPFARFGPCSTGAALRRFAEP